MTVNDSGAAQWMNRGVVLEVVQLPADERPFTHRVRVTGGLPDSDEVAFDISQRVTAQVPPIGTYVVWRGRCALFFDLSMQRSFTVPIRALRDPCCFPDDLGSPSEQQRS
jgi:hypothetical protein